MRLLFLISVLVSFFAFTQAVWAAEDTKMNCKQIHEEMEALRRSAVEPAAGLVNRSTLEKGANIATQAASIAGVGAQASLARGILGIFSALVPSSPAPAVDIEAQKRIARLEAISDMKGCK